MDGLDAIDTQIISLLIQNGRISVVDLSKETGLSRVAAKSRLESLIQRGIIEKFTIVLNPERVGRNITVSLDLQVKAENFNEACQILKENTYVHKLYQITGNSHLHAHAMLPGNTALEDFLRESIYTLPGLLRADCNIIISRIKDNSEVRI